MCALSNQKVVGTNLFSGCSTISFLVANPHLMADFEDRDLGDLVIYISQHMIASLSGVSTTRVHVSRAQNCPKPPFVILAGGARVIAIKRPSGFQQTDPFGYFSK